eukprot:TRINITY_DN24725_c0_g2_i1.p1 TRINITY_DN24725_c0_g2~~TRINITY_DN24725_c0_g2_i1.p1  ORF type:complete len:173 (+),score=23.23 TRINITY_DN24725_c0_g2_i1:186-704(+)
MIVHGDVKPANVLMDSDLQPKLIDFGLSQIRKGSAKKQGGGSLRYVAPEIIMQGTEQSCKTDMFSFGRLAFHVVTGLKPLAFMSAEELMPAYGNGLVPALQWQLTVDSLTPHQVQNYQQLCHCCLRFEPDRRCSAGDVLRGLEGCHDELPFAKLVDVLDTEDRSSRHLKVHL